MNFSILGASATLIVVGIVQLVKKVFPVMAESRFVPLVAVAAGLVLAVGYQLTGLQPAFGSWLEALIAGLVAGLASSGLWDTGRVVVNK
jgi:hypothetical protein